MFLPSQLFQLKIQFSIKTTTDHAQLLLLLIVLALSCEHCCYKVDTKKLPGYPVYSTDLFSTSLVYSKCVFEKKCR